ncbi:DUF2236 domain-containing protein [Phycicoccus endophyticus]|uniref:DUF2236 domain-containing protein n=1 Tax=Phycicoccus endophyticus TaxID=1690220 RepID=A0A7G9R413_9MICO|nr:oxygenase MpaB family protein [Phycicoccus endophyticus]NHI18177.1 DUF2236 domain-containing protein [Phycicoccus endophyticus]QNN50338.1 DUF2236 domain-containing protein [Phycicoccus endophyticus]GGL25873.1 hypothetical protein GCM10012283_05010 [Phycicoccus endophyticus]
MSAVDRLGRAAQRRLGAALRARVAGADAADRAAVIWGADGERRFGPGDPVWRVHADAAMFPGGIAALLLQSLHPSAMAGVAGHSGYRGDPWGRLQRTSHFIAATTFGTVATADAAVERVRAIHERVRGRDEDGVPYRASDPQLLLWVHAAEAWSFLAAFQRFAADPLGAEEADTYVAQAAVVARSLGAVDVPTDVAGLAATVERYRPVLRATPAARDAARFLLLDPPLPWTSRPGYGLLASGGVALLPGWARRELRLPVTGPAAGVAGVLGLVGTRAVRWAMAGVPPERRVSVPR